MRDNGTAFEVDVSFNQQRGQFGYTFTFGDGEAARVWMDPDTVERVMQDTSGLLAEITPDDAPE